MPDSKPAKKNEPTFEAAIERLEKIVEELDTDNLELEELVSRYEDGNKLLKVCEDRLSAAEKRIAIVSRTTRGEPQLEEFEPPAMATDPAPKTKPKREDVSLF